MRRSNRGCAKDLVVLRGAGDRRASAGHQRMIEGLKTRVGRAQEIELYTGDFKAEGGPGMASAHAEGVKRQADACFGARRRSS